MLREKKEIKEVDFKPRLLAKKDWLIVQNDIRVEIKKGKQIPADLPQKFLKALKSEGVI